MKITDYTIEQINAAFKSNYTDTDINDFTARYRHLVESDAIMAAITIVTHRIKAVVEEHNGKACEICVSKVIAAFAEVMVSGGLVLVTPTEKAVVN